MINSISMPTMKLWVTFGELQPTKVQVDPEEDVDTVKEIIIEKMGLDTNSAHVLLRVGTDSPLDPMETLAEQGVQSGARCTLEEIILSKSTTAVPAPTATVPEPDDNFHSCDLDQPPCYTPAASPPENSDLPVALENCSLSPPRLPLSLAVFFSAPLVGWSDAMPEKPISLLDYKSERKLLTDSFAHAGREISVKFHFAKAKTLQRALMEGATALHYSGHGTQAALAFEGDNGYVHMLDVHQLRELFEKTSGGRRKVWAAAQ